MRNRDEEAVKREAELRAEKAEKEGMEKGMKQGIEQGLEKGEIKAKERIAQRLLSDGSEVEYVAEITGLSIDSVSKMKKNMKK